MKMKRKFSCKRVNRKELNEHLLKGAPGREIHCDEIPDGFIPFLPVDDFIIGFLHVGGGEFRSICLRRHSPRRRKAG